MPPGLQPLQHQAAASAAAPEPAKVAATAKKSGVHMEAPLEFANSCDQSIF